MSRSLGIDTLPDGTTLFRAWDEDGQRAVDAMRARKAAYHRFTADPTPANRAELVAAEAEQTAALEALIQN